MKQNFLSSISTEIIKMNRKNLIGLIAILPMW